MGVDPRHRGHQAGVHRVGPDVGGVHGRAPPDHLTEGGPVPFTGQWIGDYRGDGSGNGQRLTGQGGRRRIRAAGGQRRRAEGCRRFRARADGRRQPSRWGAALLGLVVGVPEVLDVIDQPGEVMVLQPLDAANAGCGVTGAGHCLLVGPHHRRQQDHHDPEHQRAPVPRAPTAQPLPPRLRLGFLNRQCGAPGARPDREGITVTPPVHDYDMARQLALISPNEIDWRLDERTKELGRRGIAEARAALRRAARAADATMALSR